MATVIIPGVQYSGIWTMQQVNAAIAAGTWPIGSPQYLYSWGDNSNGKLGLGNTTNYSSPKQVSSTTSWLQIAAGIYSAGAVRSDGTLWMWGRGTYGALGLGNTTTYSSPKQVGSLTNWALVGVGNGVGAAIKSDGSLWTWGLNNLGQLGLGNTTYYSSPKQVGALYTWSTLTVSPTNSTVFMLATKTDGTLWSWGGNGFGQLGLGNTTTYSSPKQIGSLTTWSKISSGFAFVIAVKTDGTLWGWGKNGFGNLGLGNATNYSSPKQIGSLTTWNAIACGQGHVLATTNSNALWAWGYNSAGQLGLGSTSYGVSSPNQVGALTTWLSVAGSYQSSLSIKTDGTLWSWGANDSGQLGLGNTTYYSSPKQVGALTTWLKLGGGGRRNVLATKG